MTRVYDLVEEPELPRDVVVRRLRELAARPPMPDPRKIVRSERRTIIGRARLHTILSGLAVALAVGVVWALFWNAG